MLLSLVMVAWISPLASVPVKVYASAQTIPQEEDASNDNVENMTESASDTFLAEGTINQLIPFSSAAIDDNETLFLLGGNWVLSVDEGSVDDFVARIVMAAEDGRLLHVHTIQNLSNVTGRISPVGQEQQPSSRFDNISLSAGVNDTVAISGYADISTNGVIEWEQVAVTISIVNGNVISIIPNPAEVDHFYALPVYGIVRSLVDSSGESLRDQQLANNTTLAFHGRGGVEFNYGSADVVNGSSPGISANDQSVMNQAGINDDSEAESEQPPTYGGFITDDPTEEYPILNSTISAGPIVQQISQNQNYLVQLRWTNPGFLLPTHGLDYTIYFLDAQQPHSTEDIVPSWESNYSAFSMAEPADFIDPYILNFEAVESYDMTVYSDTGSFLWQKDDLQVYGGRDWGLITFAERYRGPITVEISDIKPAEGIIGTDEDNNLAMPDSVTFTSLVVE